MQIIANSIMFLVALCVVASSASFVTLRSSPLSSCRIVASLCVVLCGAYVRTIVLYCAVSAVQLYSVVWLLNCCCAVLVCCSM
jgi:hypothetical protein